MPPEAQDQSKSSEFLMQSEPTPAANHSNASQPVTETQRQPITHYHSISVDHRPPAAANPTRGTLKIVEHDIGGKDDLWNIQLYFIWQPKGADTEDAAKDTTLAKPLKVSIDDFLTIRTQFTLQPPSLTVHLNGGRLLGDFYFPNGPDAAMAFFHCLRDHVVPLEMDDDFIPGDLYALEKKNRMRRVAPTINTANNGDREEDFSDLLADLRIEGSSHRRPRRNMSNTVKDDLGIMLLSHFARVTQAAREIGDGISTLLDEEKRKKELERRRRENAARHRALDIHAEVTASSSEERDLPRRLTLESSRGVPVSLSVWNDSFDDDGKLIDIQVMRRAVFAGGVECDARSAVWPFLLGFYDWKSSAAERLNLLETKEAEYKALKSKWQSLQSSAKEAELETLDKDPNAVNADRRERVRKKYADYLETEEQIEKDIIRTDRRVEMFEQDNSNGTLTMGTILNMYAMYDKRTTYCQGMSDFLAPIVYVMGIDDEAIIFWSFESLMRRIESNFRHDQSGMRRQLRKLGRLMEVADRDLSQFFRETDPDYYTCFRWVLVRFKREFSFEAICRLWEALWTKLVGGDDLHLFIAAALLIAQRRDILRLEKGAFDQLLRYINDMSMRIDEEYALHEGEVCFLKYGEHSHVSS
ncbi:TBC1 domain family member 15 [Gracilariopsis chorda]|uniref:TBC1 domain family member 15 n=1 Tax=Gracilariopsis chorda TaxID=448386 RepID=A0A2V3IXA8_9FLOR|nr:TBC1 domain family member 15 [Gracilariopsis chorda]|eukprot:PXF46327.1 TBC1 domain family member 15 [Gracilariopsis chorda]